ncbi:hypothetical protein ACJX0J_020272, partial [Zea mays]
MSAHDEDGGRRRRTLAKVSLSLVSTTMAEASTYSLDAVKTRHLQLHRSPGGTGGRSVIRVAAELHLRSTLASNRGRMAFLGRHSPVDFQALLHSCQSLIGQSFWVSYEKLHQTS